MLANSNSFILNGYEFEKDLLAERSLRYLVYHRGHFMGNLYYEKGWGFWAFGEKRSSIVWESRRVAAEALLNFLGLPDKTKPFDISAEAEAQVWSSFREGL